MQQTILRARGCIRSRVRHYVLLIVLIALPGGSAFADIYKWTDKDGNIYFGDKPPQDVESEHIQVKPKAVPAQPDEGELRRLRQLEQAERDATRRIESQRARTAAERREKQEDLAQKQRCSEARQQLHELQQQLPVYRIEGGKFHAAWWGDSYEGEREYIDDATRTTEIKRMRQLIAKNCN
ncbi:MAG TPA: DUF4124 domain-containing protein [Gammaproteobacteria bacterium]